jgi:hypothetical protein
MTLTPKAIADARSPSSATQWKRPPFSHAICLTTSCEREEVLGCPRKCKLAHAFPWDYSDKGLELAQLLGQLGVFLTWFAPSPSAYPNTETPCAAWLARSIS